MEKLVMPFEDYTDWLSDLKSRIQTARMRAALAVNAELVRLYWDIGRDILARQQSQGWGAKVIDRLADDLRREFPDMKGFSRANMLYMRAFAEPWPDEAIVQQLVGQLPWGQNLVLMAKVKSREKRETNDQRLLRGHTRRTASPSHRPLQRTWLGDDELKW